ncbi:3-keto-5-aminohexanoate cleavage protein [Ruegeria sp. HKCCD7255]|uniref:3-keto-5-aminohexanoate cleavage protein n=1 Tax=Ruegeria sp. HKCCD7255 TaxID=2683004 RepID=UPI0020C305DD|nr:3-keto-5-aminohexanoate cleavage protein [Ruegeria sp. HKCCD7255]
MNEFKKPFIMVAPNGGRKTKADHPAVPTTVAELIACAQECHAAGADALHAHVRDSAGNHLLDAGQYREVLQECTLQVPELQLQITTESLDRYDAADQRKLVRDVMPQRVSVALREQMTGTDDATARQFYHWADESGIEIQHILYFPKDREWLEELQDRHVIPDKPQRVLFVLGRYEDGLPSRPENLQPFLDAGTRPTRWMACAFGQTETACLVEAHQMGGEMRIGFENNLHNADGSLAKDNAERVRDLRAALGLHDSIG